MLQPTRARRGKLASLRSGGRWRVLRPWVLVAAGWLLLPDATLAALDRAMRTSGFAGVPGSTGLLGATTGLPAPRGDDVPAHILFTSGSTGEAKGALSTHRAVTTATYSYACGLMTLLGLLTEEGRAPETPPTRPAGCSRRSTRPPPA